MAVAEKNDNTEHDKEKNIPLHPPEYSEHDIGKDIPPRPHPPTYYENRNLFILFIVGGIIIIIVPWTIYYIYNQVHICSPWPNNVINSTEPEKTTSMLDENSYYSTNVEPEVSGKLRILDRQEWIAQPEEHPSDPLKLPVPYVIIHHTATNNCSAIAQCKFLVRQIQIYHIDSNGWGDIGYNFLVGGDGFVYRGRGWKAQGAHMYGYNSKSIAIAFIGTFNKIAPPENQITAALQLIDQGFEKGYLDKNYKILAARQLQSTSSPGDVLFDIVKTFPHWAEAP